MTDEEAVKITRQMARDNPEATLRMAEALAAVNPEIAEIMKAARKARDEADARGITLDEVFAEWMLPATKWKPKS